MNNQLPQTNSHIAQLNDQQIAISLASSYILPPQMAFFQLPASYQPKAYVKGLALKIKHSLAALNAEA